MLAQHLKLAIMACESLDSTFLYERSRAREAQMLLEVLLKTGIGYLDAKLDEASAVVSWEEQLLAIHGMTQISENNQEKSTRYTTHHPSATHDSPVHPPGPSTPVNPLPPLANLPLNRSAISGDGEPVCCHV